MNYPLLEMVKSLLLHLFNGSFPLSLELYGGLIFVSVINMIFVILWRRKRVKG